MDDVIAPIPGAVREIRSYRFAEGGSFDLTVVPGQSAVLHILGIGRDQDNPADEYLAARVDVFTRGLGRIERTWGTTWSVPEELLPEIDRILGPVAHRSADVTDLSESSDAWAAMRSALPGRVYSWWTWHSDTVQSMVQIDARSEGPGLPVGIHLVDHGRTGPAQDAGQRLVDSHGPEITESGIPRLVAAMQDLPDDYREFSASGA